MAVVRLASLDDALAVARVHVESWRAAYRGMLPGDYLDALSVTDRLSSWQQWLAPSTATDSETMVVVDDDDVQGFATTRPTEDPAVLQLAALYLAPTAWGRGLGRALHDAVVNASRASGWAEMILWVHPDNNRARAFYERRGWTDDAVEQSAPAWGLQVPERRYRLDLRPRPAEP